MAYESNTQHCSRKKKFEHLDPYPYECPMKSSNDTWNPNIQTQSHSSRTRNNIHHAYHPRHCPISCLNFELKKLLTYKLTLQAGHVTDTLQHHAWNVLRECADALGITLEHDLNYTYREQLFALFLKGDQKKLPPRDETEWIKLLNQWLRNDKQADRKVYRLLAVDGFHGYREEDLKHYLNNVMELRSEYQGHARAVRILYDWLDNSQNLRSLPGTQSACIIFLTLLHFYQSKYVWNHSITFHLKNIQILTEGYLHQKADYYTDVRNVNAEMLHQLGKVYEDTFENKEYLKTVAVEWITKLTNEK